MTLHPGSAFARARGCICPVAPNAYGRPDAPAIRDYGWTLQPGCPIHPQIEKQAA